MKYVNGVWLILKPPVVNSSFDIMQLKSMTQLVCFADFCLSSKFYFKD